MAVEPALAGLPHRVLSAGWDSVAIDVGGVIFKFPRTPEAAARLRREAAILALVRPRLSLAVPDMVLFEHGGPFSRHPLIPGDHLLTAGYDRLDAAQRADLAARLARLFAELHDVPVDAATALGAPEIGLALAPEETLSRLAPLLPAAALAFAEAAFAGLAACAEPPREIFGHFDVHGWNLAFDHAAGRLNGLYDFGDAGLGPRHKDLSYPAWIDPGLCRAIAARYAALTGRRIEPDRVLLHNTALRLTELAEGVFGNDSAAGIAMLEAWRARLAEA